MKELTPEQIAKKVAARLLRKPRARRKVSTKAFLDFLEAQLPEYDRMFLRDVHPEETFISMADNLGRLCDPP